jgi:hypothetical protein
MDSRLEAVGAREGILKHFLFMQSYHLGKAAQSSKQLWHVHGRLG